MTYPPSAIEADVTNVTPTPDLHPLLHNLLAAAVNDIVTELGTDPKATAADVTARLAAVDAVLAALGTAAGHAASDFQPADSDLSAIAVLATTSYGRAFLALVDAAAGRTALGLGSSATQPTSAFDPAGAADAAAGASVPLTQKGAANGVATLDSGSKIPTSQLPALAITDSFPVASQAAMLALAAQRGDLAIRSDVPGTFVLAADDPTVLANWLLLPIPTDAVLSVNGQTGVVTGLAEQVDLASEATTARANETANATAITARVRPRGAWVAFTAYAVNDIFTNNGGVYLVTVAFTSGAAFDATGLTVLQSPFGTYALTAQNLADLASAATARTNLGLGDAATHVAADFDAAGAAAAAQAASQPVDSDLTAIAALATTVFGRSFLALADAAAGRTLLALGTAATQATTAFDTAGAASAAQAASQPLDSDLTAIAALTTTAFGRSVLTQADAAALRTLADALGSTISAWAATTAYTKGQLVTFNGSTWMANAAFTSGSTFDPTNWTLVQGGAFGFPFTVDPGIIRFNTDAIALSASANAAIYARCQHGGSISKVGLEVVASSGNISVAAYRNSGAGRNGQPTGGQLATSGAVACPSIGYAEVSLGSTVILLPGDWLAISADNATATFRSLLSSAGDNNLGLGRQFRQATAHPLPTTPAGVARVGSTIVLIGVA